MSYKRPSKVIFAIICFVLMMGIQFLFVSLSFADTRESPSAAPNIDWSQRAQRSDVSPIGGTTQSTVNDRPYLDAKGFTETINTSSPQNVQNIRRDVSELLKRDNYDGEAERSPNRAEVFVPFDQLPTSEVSDAGGSSPTLTTLIAQAAEQNRSTETQEAVAPLNDTGIGSLNPVYRGLHQWYKDDIVGNLFGQSGQLVGKWLSEFEDGWMADTVQFLAGFLRTFVLNPNVAVNQDDGISIHIRQGADLMYAIASDLLLLLFILAIWRYWVDAAWRGNGNLMGAVGRLIFTAGVMLAWPTIYAFDVQITNEMIQALYPGRAAEVLMLDEALASIVRGGILASAGGLVHAFAPLLGTYIGSSIGGTVGGLFAFAGLIVFLIIGGILIAQLVYLLVLKATQTALLTAQYMFAPIFLVFFATPNTESVSSGFIKSFVETSLWTFVWVGLLKIMVIMMASDFNPWGKALLAIGIVQLMIQVPSFLARAQISPLSDYITAGLIMGGLFKMLQHMSEAATMRLDQVGAYFTDQRYANRGQRQTTALAVNPNQQSANDEMVHKLKTLAELEREEQTRNGAGSARGPHAKHKRGVGAAPSGEIVTATEEDLNKGLETGELRDPRRSTQNPPILRRGQPGHTGRQGQQPQGQTDPNIPRQGRPLYRGPLTGEGQPPSQNNGHGQYLDGDDDAYKTYTDNLSIQDFPAKNLQQVWMRRLISDIRGLGVRIVDNQPESKLIPDRTGNISQIHFRAGASGAEKAHLLTMAAFAREMNYDPTAQDAARQAAIDSGADKPQGIWETLYANRLRAQGKSFKETTLAKERFNLARAQAAARGAEAYINGGVGANAYTSYLQDLFGGWTTDDDANAVYVLTNPQASESPYNQGFDNANLMAARSGLRQNTVTRAAYQNIAVRSMHPSRQGKAALALIASTYAEAKEKWGDEDPLVMENTWAEMLRHTPADRVQHVMALYESTAGADLDEVYRVPITAGATAIGGESVAAHAASYEAMKAMAPYLAYQRRYIAEDAYHNVTTLNSLGQAMQKQGHEGQVFLEVLQDTSDLVAGMARAGINVKMLVADPGQAALTEAVQYMQTTCGGNFASPQAASHLKLFATAMNMYGSGITQEDINIIGQVANVADGNVSSRNVVACQMLRDNNFPVTQQSLYIAAQACALDKPQEWLVASIDMLSQNLVQPGLVPKVVDTLTKEIANNLGVQYTGEADLYTKLPGALSSMGASPNLSHNLVQLVTDMKAIGNVNDNDLAEPATVRLLLRGMEDDTRGIQAVVHAVHNHGIAQVESQYDRLVPAYKKLLDIGIQDPTPNDVNKLKIIVANPANANLIITPKVLRTT